ncbi:terminase-like family [Longilinea arvoryzae]|uniref:Terminase-like family n=1 Tax=Longilinea arvoryzae TaxID=360412 RepID=A0A0S7BGG2_9CHLR|nr:hypothetical protein [Longilinea arvoryzae]GAP12897.1 terminase-like family [Longilinea arvoryzae]
MNRKTADAEIKAHDVLLALTKSEAFSQSFSHLRLRKYQEAALAVAVHSVMAHLGLTLVVMFPRQSGKNELQAQLEAFLLVKLQDTDAELVKVSPTWKPQSLNAMRRLERVLMRNELTRGKFSKESGYIFRIGRARIYFLSAAPEANIVGATASTLLEVDEAQDVQIAKFDKDIAPMAASTNATRIFWGTAWTAHTLLARELRAARQLEARDGQRRTFVTSAIQVGDEVPAYRAFVEGQIASLGRDHPAVRSQFFSQELDDGGGLFTAQRRALMQGGHLTLNAPRPGQSYALLLDVGGEDAGSLSGGDPANPGRDSTALTVVEVDLSTCADPLVHAPAYRCVARQVWQGAGHDRLYREVRAQAEHWRARWLVVDATGIGAGLAAFLERSLPGRVHPFVFSAASKSKLGWDFTALVDAGRWKEPRDAGELGALFLRQAEGCTFSLLPGPEKRMRWGVPESANDPLTGGRLHDDLLLSAALAAVLDELPWPSGAPVLLVKGRDPLEEMEGKF